MMIETDRLVLRRFRKEDLRDLYEYLSDETVVRFEPYQPMALNEVKDDLDRRISTDEMIAVELKTNQKLIGNMYLGKRECNTLELGYVFAGVHRIYAECDPCNAASLRLLERYIRVLHPERSDDSKIDYLSCSAEASAPRRQC